MRLFTFAFFINILLYSFSYGQTKTEWRDNSKLTVLDFRAEAPKSREGQGQSYYLAGNLDFAYAMSSYEFMLTKNFNKFVTAYYNPDLSWLQQGEGTEVLLKYAQMDFDLLELHARKYRLRLYTEKKALSNPKFFQQAHDEIMADMAKRQMEMHNTIAESAASRDAFHEQVLKEIGELAEFCKECKPAKKK